MRIRGILAAAAVSAAVLPADAFADDKTEVIDGITYTYEIDSYDNTAIIASADIPEEVKEIIIPAEIGGYAVTSIKERAYAGSFYIEKVTIPSNIRQIGKRAFISCTALSEVIIEDGLRGIPEDCFFSCPNLASVILPDTVTSIGSESFFGCTELDMVIPASVTYIGNDALGKEADHHSEGSMAVPNFLIKGKTDSAAEEYAVLSGIDFIDMENFRAGDVNEDGLVDADDASDVLSEYSQISVGLPASFSRKQNVIADMDSNDLIDADDASTVLRIYSELSTSHAE